MQSGNLSNSSVGKVNTDQKTNVDSETSNTRIMNRSSVSSNENTKTISRKDSQSSLSGQEMSNDLDRLGEVNEKPKKNNYKGEQMLGMLVGDMPETGQDPEIKEVNKAVRKLGSEKSRKKLDKLENLRDGLTDKQQVILDQEIQTLKSEKLGKASEDLNTFVDNFIKLTDPGITISKSRILPLHDVLERFARETDPDKKLALYNEVKNEIANYRQASPNSSKMKWVDELENQLSGNNIKPILENEDIKAQFAQFNRIFGNENSLNAILELDDIKKNISQYQANGNNSPLLNKISEEINAKRDNMGDGLLGYEKRELKHMEYFDSLIKELDLNNPEETKQKMESIVVLNNPFKILDSNNYQRTKETLENRIRFHAPELEHDDEALEKITNAIFHPIDNSRDRWVQFEINERRLKYQQEYPEQGFTKQ